MYCSKCGVNSPDGAEFCSNCGNRLFNNSTIINSDPVVSTNDMINADLAQSAMAKGIVGVALAGIGIPGIVLGTMAKNTASDFAYSNGGKLFGKAKVGAILGKVAVGVGIGFTCFWAFYFTLIMGIIGSLA